LRRSLGAGAERSASMRAAAPSSTSPSVTARGLCTRAFSTRYLRAPQGRPETRAARKVDRDAYRPGRFEMVNPQIEVIGSEEKEGVDSTEVGRIVPIYEAMGGISSRILRRIIYNALQNFTAMFRICCRRKFVRATLSVAARGAALRALPARNVSLECSTVFAVPRRPGLSSRSSFTTSLDWPFAARRESPRESPCASAKTRCGRSETHLPFKPTAAQKRVLAEIAADLERPFPMHRLLEGDVGSGKHRCARGRDHRHREWLSSGLMAPTEILAASTTCRGRIFQAAGYNVALVVSGRKRAEKEAAIESIEKASAPGRGHARLDRRSYQVRPARPRHHRRAAPLRRSPAQAPHRKGASPHVLVMTATPIPRTLALTLYGDLDLSVIDELPPGRTRLKPAGRRKPSFSCVGVRAA